MINFDKKYKVHFMGIGGISISSLALFCKTLGWKVSGSDLQENNRTIKCNNNGIKIYFGQRSGVCGNLDFVVKSGSIKDNNKELMDYIKRGIRVLDRSEFLGEITKQYKNVVAVSGTHGKSTTSYMIYSILNNAKKSVSCHIGAEIEKERFNLNDDILVLEACEYNKSFLNFKVDTAIILNVDNDHLECYGGMKELQAGFLTFIQGAKTKYVFDNSTTKYINGSDIIKVKKPNIINDTFVVDGDEYTLLNFIGKQYVYDACVAIKVCKDLGVEYKSIYSTLKTLIPLPRRQEVVGKINKTNIMIDYAHHPTEIKYLLESFDKNTLFIFQPHTFSRTKYLIKDFVKVLKNVDLIIYKEYSAREKHTDGVTAFDLFKMLKLVNKRVRYYCNKDELLKEIDFDNWDNVIFVGAGDIDQITKSIIL